MRKLLLYLLAPLLLYLNSSCQNDHRDAQEQFRERQEAILERDAEQEAELDTLLEDGELDVELPDATETADPTTSASPSTTAGDKVTAIKDGDTIELLRNGEEITIRLYGIDAPEKNQDFGQRSKQFASDLAFGKQVRLIAHNKDRYGRTVGTIILPDGRNMNEEMVRNGMAWHYKAYSKDVNLANAEADARRFKRGLWQDPNPTPPWDFRKEKRSSTTTSTPTAVIPIPAVATKRTVYLCNSSGSAVYHLDKNCSVLKRCKTEVLTVTEAVAIKEYGRRADKTCSK